MAYDEDLARQVQNCLNGLIEFTEKKIFGGVCFLIRGNMAFGILNRDLIVRVGLQNYDAALKRPNTRKFDFTGRPIKGWVLVSFENHLYDRELSSWVEEGVNFAKSLPPK
jgi:hypothetical protein